jgi:hypothetical protein
VGRQGGHRDANSTGGNARRPRILALGSQSAFCYRTHNNSRVAMVLSSSKVTSPRWQTLCLQPGFGWGILEWSDLIRVTPHVGRNPVLQVLNSRRTPAYEHSTLSSNIARDISRQRRRLLHCNLPLFAAQSRQRAISSLPRWRESWSTLVSSRRISPLKGSQ